MARGAGSSFPSLFCDFALIKHTKYSFISHGNKVVKLDLFKALSDFNLPVFT